MNKNYLFPAFVFFIGAVSVLLDWIIFWKKNYQGDFPELREAYINHFPNFLQPFFNSKLSTFFFVLACSAAGWIFLKQQHLIYKLLAVSSFLLAFWYLFTLM
ncbi:hypothetical protein H1R16_02245 [Marnyiella aurantia]|uniref:DUF1772 domain-containing protein n=1 Tax=Marnyiella aurantia TaxID=2758037 RepID=A0A7D7LTZ3_9FLAO|nr:hypothetical protein [Marnyiella aurantia]MBA5245741.1 hypothetical protein [Marnyiella aurantia]QMS98855.1 hypothetical protein H1R16_02245 [Marnyiella aurantia]